MKYKINLQNLVAEHDVPNRFLMQRWVNTTLENQLENAELGIRIVDEAEMLELNKTYRNKTGTTNILSFPYDLPTEVELDKKLLGDLVVCAPVVKQEAEQQGKTLEAHWAHLIIHGTLHLLGFDHIKETDAQVMEALEIKLLEQLGHPNPYGETLDHD